VFVLNVVDGCIPSDLGTGSNEEIEEERRLLYVAMTRAKEHLHLLVPHRFYVTQQSVLGDRHLYASRSRFIPNALAKQFDQVIWPTVTVDGGFNGIGGQASVQVRERARSAWR
jgi:DNA helicase-2/ATP-dependent DNA helicase PcrA